VDPSISVTQIQLSLSEVATIRNYDVVHLERVVQESSVDRIHRWVIEPVAVEVAVRVADREYGPLEVFETLHLVGKDRCVVSRERDQRWGHFASGDDIGFWLKGSMLAASSLCYCC